MRRAPVLTAMLHDLATAAAEVAGARYGAVGVLDHTGRRLAHFVTVHLDGDGSPAAPPDPALTRTFLGVPIHVDGRVLGRIYLTDKSGGREFTDEDEARVALVASRVALALRRSG